MIQKEVYAGFEFSRILCIFWNLFKHFSTIFSFSALYISVGIFLIFFRIFLEYSGIFGNLFQNFPTIFQNFPTHFLHFLPFPVSVGIFWQFFNFFWNFSNFLRHISIFDNCGKFQKRKFEIQQIRVFTNLTPDKCGNLFVIICKFSHFLLFWQVWDFITIFQNFSDFLEIYSKKFPRFSIIFPRIFCIFCSP